MIRSAAITLSLLSAIAAAQPPVRAITLSAPVATFDESFTTISFVTSAPDGSVYVADGKDNVVKRLTRTGAAKVIGRQGAGPGEYGRPSRLSWMRGDTLIVTDPQHGRLLFFTVDGKPAGLFSAADIPSSSALTTALISNGMVGVDAQGRLYFESRLPLDKVPASGVITDSLMVLRVDRATKSVETVAHLLGPTKRVAIAGTSSEIKSVSINVNPLSVSEASLVDPAGQVIVARLNLYHLSFFPKGNASHEGTPIRLERTGVTDEIKTAVLARDAERRGIADARKIESIPDWPEFVPAFARGSALLDARGRVWLEQPASTRSVTRYDVLDNSGKLVLVVSMAPSVRVVGFTATGILTARVQEDGLQILELRPAP